VVAIPQALHGEPYARSCELLVDEPVQDLERLIAARAGLAWRHAFGGVTRTTRCA